MRYHSYEHTDDWLALEEHGVEFFDLILSSHDTYKVKDSEINPGDKIAGLYFRLANERMDHEKEVTQFDEYLDSIAGLWEVLLILA